MFNEIKHQVVIYQINQYYLRGAGLYYKKTAMQSSILLF